MKDLEVKMYKFFADRGQTFDDLQMCWKPAVEEFVQFCEIADEDHEKKVKATTAVGEVVTTADEFTTRIPRDGIIYLKGLYRVTVMVQDGYEKCGEFTDEQEAKEKWASAMNALNGKGHTAADAPETIRFEPVYKQIVGYKQT